MFTKAQQIDEYNESYECVDKRVVLSPEGKNTEVERMQAHIAALSPGNVMSYIVVIAQKSPDLAEHAEVSVSLGGGTAEYGLMMNALMETLRRDVYKDLAMMQSAPAQPQ